MATGVVTFDPFAFKIRYPEFNSVSNATLTAYFGDATLYLSNLPNSIVQCLSTRARLLNMLTAHIGYLSGALSSDGQVRPVGRLSQASEGSVSASFDYGVPGSQEWFTQSQYGAAYWQATSSLRGMRYRPRPLRVC